MFNYLYIKVFLIYLIYSISPTAIALDLVKYNTPIFNCKANRIGDCFMKISPDNQSILIPESKIHEYEGGGFSIDSINLKIIDISSNRLKRNIKFPTKYGTDIIARLSPKTSYIFFFVEASPYGDRTYGVINSTNGRLLWTSDKIKEYRKSLFTADGKSVLLFYPYQNVLKIVKYKLSNGQKQSTLTYQLKFPITVSESIISKDSKTVYVSYRNFDYRSGLMSFELIGGSPIHYFDKQQASTISLNERYSLLASSYEQKSASIGINIWDLKTSSITSVLRFGEEAEISEENKKNPYENFLRNRNSGPKFKPTSLTISNNAKYLAANICNESKGELNLVVWNIKNRKIVFQKTDKKDCKYRKVAFIQNNSTLIRGGGYSDFEKFRLMENF